jgi:hypothetical protein
MFSQSALSADAAMQGSWINRQGGLCRMILIQDDYLIFTVYDEKNPTFHYCWGGPLKRANNQLLVRLDFHSKGIPVSGPYMQVKLQQEGDRIQLDEEGKLTNCNKLKDPEGALTGVWRISSRQQNGQMTSIPLRARRTLKLLTGNRFQWVAISIETGEFFGTGGGSYQFDHGRYTENIAFFSRDSSRVGQKLQFSDKLLSDGQWEHSGNSSKGETLFEIWTRWYPSH